jgi:hypothetical protein
MERRLVYASGVLARRSQLLAAMSAVEAMVRRSHGCLPTWLPRWTRFPHAKRRLTRHAPRHLAQLAQRHVEQLAPQSQGVLRHTTFGSMPLPPRDHVASDFGSVAYLR